MTGGEIAFLGVVVGGFTVFAVTLAYVDWWHRRTPKREEAPSSYSAPIGFHAVAR